MAAAKKRAAKAKAKPRPGRPARAGVPMVHMLRVRFSEPEWAKLGEAATRAGTSMSDVVRSALERAGVL